MWHARTASVPYPATARSNAIPDDRLVPEEGVLRTGLAMVARRLFPLSSSDGVHLPNRAIASARPRLPSRYPCRLGRWHHDSRATRAHGIVEGGRVVGRVARDARQAAVDGLDQCDGRRRVVDSGLGQRVGHDDTRSVDTQMELLPSARPAYAMLRPGPLAFADHRQSRTIDDQVEASARRDSSTREVEALATP